MNNSIGYKGKVIIKYIKDGKERRRITTYNTGSLPLFNFITNCLTGNFSKKDVPNYIVGYYSSNTESVSSTDLGECVFTSPLISTDSSVENNVSNSVANIKFLIPSQIIKLEGNQTVNVIALYSESNIGTHLTQGGTNPSAYIILEQDDIIESEDLGTNNNYVIIWKLTISNK